MQYRIDDIGASTKHFEQHGKKLFTYRGIPYFYFPFANIGFFKRIWPFRRWGKYDELTAREWRTFLTIFKEKKIIPIIAITAAWVDERGELTPYPEKFPEAAQVLKQAAKQGEIIIANHGLTHCVVGKHRPLFWHSNRQWHREFLESIPFDQQRDHIIRAQSILESFFEQPIEIFVPPGNQWCRATYLALAGTHIKKVISLRYMNDSTESMRGIEFIDDRHGFFNFHDRELKLYGVNWLLKKINI